jgi:hypothetical protein
MYVMYAALGHRFPMVTLPPSLVFQDSRIAAAQLYPDVSKLLFHDLFESGDIRFDPSVLSRQFSPLYESST